MLVLGCTGVIAFIWEKAAPLWVELPSLWPGRSDWGQRERSLINSQIAEKAGHLCLALEGDTGKILLGGARVWCLIY